MELRFAVLSDLHIGLPHTIADHPTRFHLVEVSIPAFEQVLTDLTDQNIDFLLIPGDLTQHGEPENHAWLANRLAQLPFPVYVIPGNHDVPVLEPDGYSIGFDAFPEYYRAFGYHHTDRHYYVTQPLPGVQLIGLNSNQFIEQRQVGRLDQQQLEWLTETLQAIAPDQLVLVMVHHNILEHFPQQSDHPIGQRYFLENATELHRILQAFGVQLVFTGHLHVQDVAHHQGIYDITTGSLVSYPHPYRLVELTVAQGKTEVSIRSGRVHSLADWPDLQTYSREWMGDRSVPFMTRMLAQEPLSLSPKEAAQIAPEFRYFWATIANGDPEFTFPNLPDPLRKHFESYSHRYSPESQLDIGDNHTTLVLKR